MVFISYAQNCEDVMLWRALKHIEHGFYIDVGAQDPEVDSVTKAFYNRGWRGINIEPSDQWYEKLNQKRPEDINLKLAAGAEEGDLNFYEIPDTGLSTLDEAIAEEHASTGGYMTNQSIVKVRTINSICGEYSVSLIHFMKIDVEGAEKDVIEGIDFSIIRPWILVVESTLPNTQIENHQDWEQIILDSNYKYVYFDGLNRYYISVEHSELLSSFLSPPNCFDRFIKADQYMAETRAVQAETWAVQAETRAVQAETRAVQAETRAVQVTIQLQDVLASQSWRYTKPLRLAGNFLRVISNPKKMLIIFRSQSQQLLYLRHVIQLVKLIKWLIKLPSRGIKWVIRRINNLLKKMLKVFFRIANRIPFLKKIGKSIITRIPALESKLKRIIQLYKQASFPTGSESYVFMTDTNNLSPRARQIYENLKAAYENKGKVIE